MKKRIFDFASSAIVFFSITIIWAKTMGFKKYPQKQEPETWEEIYKDIPALIIFSIFVGIMFAIIRWQEEKLKKKKEQGNEPKKENNIMQDVINEIVEEVEKKK